MLKKIVFLFFSAFIAISEQCFGEGLSLGTRPGFELGIQASRYKYEEEIARITGNKLGVAGSYTKLFKEDSFVTADGRIAYGRLLYEGSDMSGTSGWGTLDNVPDLNVEVRIVAGKDFYSDTGNSSLSPYAGIGYRYLFSNITGRTTTNTVGYRRHSQYLYVPLGLRSRIKMNDRFVFAPTVEYDWFLEGKQISQLTDTGLWRQDAVNKQKHGYGYRLSFMFETGPWSFGPWMHYWKIEKSEETPIGAPVNNPNFQFVSWEPQNKTREFGFEVRYLF